jgi:tRNA dimethylallyltransferase
LRKTVPILLIAGPTASGKSALAQMLAKKLDGVIVNADSMQIYQDLRILSARPSRQEEQSLPHQLYGHINGAVNYSVGHYLEEVKPLLAGERPLIFVGGTGLYFKAMLEGLSDIPPVPDEVRAHIRAAYEHAPTADIHAALRSRDPLAAEHVRPTDRLRTLRALEVFEATGLSIRAWRERKAPALLGGQLVRKLFLWPDRAALYRAIDQRFEAMIKQGALEEVELLAERQLDPLLPVMRAHGVPSLIAFLKGEMTLEAAIVKGQADTRHYAKRQLTWFRHQMADWQALSPQQAQDWAQQAQDWAIEYNPSL